MLQLEQLNGPLHVGDAARTEFGVLGRVGAAGQAFGLDPSLQLANLEQLRGAQAALRPPMRVDLGHQRIAKLLDHRPARQRGPAPAAPR